jgi:4-hydroxybenzoate polyprenyltransferase
MMSVLVLALYIDSPVVQAQYAAPILLWGICPCALMWVSRIWLAARRGGVHDDPIVHALRDVRGLVLVAACVGFVLAAQSSWVASAILNNPIWR